MALADRQQKPDTRNRFERWLDSLSDSNRAIVVGWLMDPSIPNSSIRRWIAEDDPEDDFTGYPCNPYTISEWRRVHAR